MSNYILASLSKEFFQDYDPKDFPELEHKEGRPYLVFLIKIENNTFAVPFRTNIRHKFAYRFKNTGRETESRTGLDFTKAVIVNEERYIGEEEKLIDDIEYIELDSKFYFIQNQFKRYVLRYHKHLAGELDERQSKAYRFTTLKYFHKELGIEN